MKKFKDFIIENRSPIRVSLNQIKIWITKSGIDLDLVSITYDNKDKTYLLDFENENDILSFKSFLNSETNISFISLGGTSDKLIIFSN